MRAAQRASLVQDSLFTADRKEELAAYGLPQFWIVASRIELQALREGVVSTNLLKQIEAYLVTAA